jgi:hypothetical protein
MRTPFTSLAAAALLAAAVPAQSCGTLTVQGGAPGTTFDLALAGATADAFAFVFVGTTLGATTIPLPASSLTLGLAAPFVPVPLGATDGQGNAALQVQVPAQVPQQISLHAQAATIAFSLRPFSLSACASNVASFTIG